MTKVSRPLAVIVALAAALAARPAFAESVDSRMAALGWQTEHATEVAVVTVVTETADEAARTRTADVRVEEAIRGRLGAGAVLRVVVPLAGGASPWKDGAKHLVFLAKSPVADAGPPAWSPVAGGYALRPLAATGPESRFPEIARSIASTLGERGEVDDAPRLRALLVAWMEDADPGIAWSAATDFARHGEFADAMPAEERARVLAAFRRAPFGKAAKPALAFALAASRAEGAAAAIADALLDPAARPVRGALAEALRRTRDPAAESLVVTRLKDAAPDARAALLVALGAVGSTSAAADAAASALADAAPAVRAEAAHALGEIARNARETDAAARVPGRAALETLVVGAATPTEAQAALWALAQLDEQDAWSFLRKSAAEDPREPVRRLASRYLQDPRQALVLE